MNQRRHLTAHLPVHPGRGMNHYRKFQHPTDPTHIKPFSGSPEDKLDLLDREEGEIDSEEGGGGGEVSKISLDNQE